MPKALRHSAAPIYLFMCLLLGGSAQGIWSNALLQLVGLGIIAWSAIAGGDEPLARRDRQLMWLVVAALILVALQLIPLPAALWPHLGGREEIAEGYRLLGVATPARPLSLAPYESLATVLRVIPAIALLCAIVRLRAYRRSWLALALLAGTMAGILLGAMQVASADPRNSPWYLYPRSSFGLASGFFANANHMALLLVVSLPFLAALLASARRKGVQRYSAAMVLAAAAALVVVVGLALNRSLAGYLLAVPVLVLSTLIIARTRSRLRPWITATAAVLLVVATALLAASPVGERRLGTASSVQSRAEFLAVTSEAVGEFLPFGSGLGTFRPVYRLYEDHDAVAPIVVNHAHNDYLELALETGVPGILLMILFLVWWGRASWGVWRQADGGAYAKAASIASAAVLAHSLVDFPLRTAAISAVFAMCLALLVERRRTGRSDRSELRPARHVVLK